MKRLDFDLPLPPSKNELHGLDGGIRLRQENEAKRKAWASACGQHLPSSTPPAFVILRAHFRTGNTWDETNLYTALNLVTDALERPVGGPPNWRYGIHEKKGFWLDDSPRHMEIEEVTQEVEPNRRRRGLTLRVAAFSRKEAAVG